jgi:hypothetical protein
MDNITTTTTTTSQPPPPPPPPPSSSTTSNTTNKTTIQPDHILFQAIESGTCDLSMIENATLDQINYTGNKDDSPIHLLCGSSPKTSSKLLLALILKGANVNATNQFNNTPLMRAAANHLKDHIQILIENGANMMAVDRDDWTCLHYCANWNGPIEMAQLILENMDCHNGENVQHGAASLAQRQGHEELSFFIKNYGGSTKAAKFLA